mgnify:FL=1
MTYPLRNGSPALVLAPMEGVTDVIMRDVLTRHAPYTHCVTEFIRISVSVPKVNTLKSVVPELAVGARTPVGCPVQVQFLGGDVENLAQAAQNAVLAGAQGIDLNFGCPAPTVNRHDGGAALLKHPERIEKIVSAVRAAVPAHLPVSAKLRLGWDNTDAIYENARRAARGGASWITIHGRTKEQGYRPPAIWEPMGIVRRELGIPVVANGDLWTLDDLRRCRDITGCEHFMLGRSAMGNPLMVHAMAAELGLHARGGQAALPTPESFEPLFLDYCATAVRHGLPPGSQLKKLKQWLGLAAVGYGLTWTRPLKLAQDLDQFFIVLRQIGGGSKEKEPLTRLPALHCA